MPEQGSGRGQGRAWAHSCERVSEQVDPNECAPRTGSRVRGSAHPRRPSPVLRRLHAPDVPPTGVLCAAVLCDPRPASLQAAPCMLCSARWLRHRPAPCEPGVGFGARRVAEPSLASNPPFGRARPTNCVKVSRQGTRVANGANARGVAAINLSGYKPKNLLICEANKNI